MTQTCCPRRGTPVTVVALSRLVLHSRVPVRAPGLQSSPMAVPEPGAFPMPLPAVAQHRGGSVTPCPPDLGTRPTQRVGKRRQVPAGPARGV